MAVDLAGNVQVRSAGVGFDLLEPPDQDDHLEHHSDVKKSACTHRSPSRAGRGAEQTKAALPTSRRPHGRGSPELIDLGRPLGGVNARREPLPQPHRQEPTQATIAWLEPKQAEVDPRARCHIWEPPCITPANRLPATPWGGT
ncbi:uncharacterized protein N7459_001798 [Penicillium hispanicum]|uniref:uncharacterized protein n=1 Tax=Penicillium hispanicum TaxID=1080232 RepID=UPI0025425C39|nr:uncharacterized protein N7459_001798 [Penicillium hispanicum]KAJ5595590.1 hypothetical protein N7459_001798 [Penicillium hispanicum]